MQILLKTFGAFLIFSVGAVLGMRKGQSFVLRSEMLADMVCFLQYIMTNLHFRRDTTCDILLEALANASLKKLPFSLQRVPSAQLPQALDTALKALAQKTKPLLNDSELQQFGDALLQLGRSEAEEETQKLSYAIAVLAGAASEAAQEAKIQCKMYRTLGLSAGAAAAVLLL